MKTTLDPRPIPGAIDGQQWTVRISPPQPIGPGRRALGSTDSRNRAMDVPDPADKGDTLARWVALHELGHARWTPPNTKPAKIAAKHRPATELDVQVVEDCRINSHLHRAGLLRHLPRETEEQLTETAFDWAEAWLAPTKRGRVLEAMACGFLQAAQIPHGCKCAETDHSRSGDEFRTLLRLTLARIGQLAEQARANAPTDRIPAPEHPEAVAAAFRDAAHVAVRIGREVSGILGKGKKRSLGFRAVGPAAAHLRRCLDAAMENQRPSADPGGGLPPPRSNRPDAEWGTLRDLPPLALTETTPAEALLRRRVATNTGNRIGALRRLLTDGRCFTRAVRKPARGGTVLIDTSGSMHLDPADVHAVLAKLPAATVAIYSGSSRSGAVSVIAQNGRTASAAAIKKRVAEVGGGNIVDGPALRWLGQQAEPRHWICDGLVTGCGDVNATHLAYEAEALRRRHRIRRTESLAQLTATLEGPQ